MRVLLVVEEPYGGSGVVLLKERELLVQNQHEVAFLGYKASLDVFPRQYHCFGSKFHRSHNALVIEDVSDLFSKLEENWTKLIKLFLGPYLDAGTLQHAIKDFRPDIIHFHGYMNNFIQPEFLRTASHYGVPFIVTCHETLCICPSGTLLKGGSNGEQCDAICSREKIPGLSSLKYRCTPGLFTSLWHFYRFNRRSRHNVLAKYVDLITTPSALLREYILKNTSVSSDKIKLYRNPAAIQPLNKTIPVGPESYFLFYGRFVPEKGLLQLLEAFSQLPEIPLVIIGEGPLKDKIITEIKTKNLNNIKLHGWKQPDELQVFIQNSIATIMPAIGFDNAPMTILESYNLGRPCIASNFGGATELILDNQTGYLYSPHDIKKLKAQILTLWQNPELADTFGLAGNQYVRNLFPIENEYENLMKMYEEARLNATQKNEPLSLQSK